MKFSRDAKATYRTISRSLVEAGLRKSVGGCREESVVVDRFGRIEKREICRLSFKAPKEGITNVERLQFVDLASSFNEDDKKEFIDILNGKIGKKNPTLLSVGTISRKGVRSCNSTNSNPSCSTRLVPAVVADEAFEKRPALVSKDQRIICTFISAKNPAKFFEIETCLISLSNELGLSEKELIARYPQQTRVILLEEVKCLSRTKRIVAGTRAERLYPNRIQTFISNIGGHAFEREFLSVKFSRKVEDLGVFCAVTDVDDLQRKDGYEQSRYKNVIACDTSLLSEITYVRRLATFDSKSCNFPLSHLK